MDHTNLTQNHSVVDIEKVPLNQEEHFNFLLVFLAPVFCFLVVYLILGLFCPERPNRKEEILTPEEMLLPFHEQQLIINLHGSGI